MSALRRVALVARLELLEHRRQPMMLAAMASVLLAVCGLVVGLLGMLQAIASSARSTRVFAANLAAAGIPLDDPVPVLVDSALSALNVLLFAQLLGMTAVLAAHSVLHDRQLGTLPFLLLAPVRRGELLAGRVLGAAATPLLLYLVFGGSAALLASLFPITEGAGQRLPFAPGWTVAFALGGPAWALATGTAGTVVSALARDVRSSQQGAWLVVFFVTAGSSYALGSALQKSLGFQLGLAAAGLLAAAAGLALGTALLRRDLSR